MHQNFIYTLILLSIYFIGSSQDLIIKRDSSVIEATVYKVDPNEITYAPFLMKDSTRKILKSEVSKIIFMNRTEILFNSTTNFRTDTVLTYHITEKIKVHRPGYDTVNVPDYIKFNIQGGIVIYSSFCNVPRRNDVYMTSSTEYLQVSDKQKATLNIGFNFLFGKSPYVKHVIGANYLRTTGEYYYSKGNIGYSIYSRNKSKVDFINITSGLRFTVFRKLHIEPLLALNIVAHSKMISTGTETTVNMQSYVRTTTSFERTSAYPDVETTVSLSPKISYQLPVKNIIAEVFISYNLAYRYKLPWYQFGFHLYPFKN